MPVRQGTYNRGAGTTEMTTFADCCGNVELFYRHTIVQYLVSAIDRSSVGQPYPVFRLRPRATTTYLDDPCFCRYLHLCNNTNHIICANALCDLDAL